MCGVRPAGRRLRRRRRRLLVAVVCPVALFGRPPSLILLVFIGRFCGPRSAASGRLLSVSLCSHRSARLPHFQSPLSLQLRRRCVRVCLALRCSSRISVDDISCRSSRPVFQCPQCVAVNFSHSPKRTNLCRRIAICCAHSAPSHCFRCGC